MKKRNSQHILKVLEIAEQLMALANNKLAIEDINYAILAAVMRDCAYKIRNHVARNDLIRTNIKNSSQQTRHITLKKAVIVLLLFVLAFSAQVSQAAYVDVVDGLSPLGYWRLGESSGTTVIDYSNGYNGTYSGGVTLGATGNLAGDSDTAADFDGSDGTVTIGPSADLLLTGDLSVSFWFNADSFPIGNTPEPLFTLTADAASSGTAKLAELAVDKNNDIVYTHEYGTNGGSEQTYIFSTANLSPDTWYNIALIRDSSAKDVYLYINDTLLDTYSYTTQPEGYTEGTLNIGGYTSTNFDGTIDEFAIFGSTLTSQNVSDIYDAALVPEPATVCFLGLGALVLCRRRRPLA